MNKKSSGFLTDEEPVGISLLYEEWQDELSSLLLVAQPPSRRGEEGNEDKDW